MIGDLQDFLVTGVFAFMICFVRTGTALMILPGFGDSFISTRIRLLMALAITFVLFPLIMPNLPDPVPSGPLFFILIMMEFIIGLLIGTIGRILMAALDVAGMMISMQSGLANAQLFNPALSSQGSLMGVFLSITAGVLIFASNLHHLLLGAVIQSYDLFPLGSIPDTGGMVQMVGHAVSRSFEIGIKMAAPFFIIILLMYVGVGIMARLMPQIQVIMVMLPLQLSLSFITLSFALSAMFFYWLTQFEEEMVFFLSQAGG